MFKISIQGENSPIKEKVVNSPEEVVDEIMSYLANSKEDEEPVDDEQVFGNIDFEEEEKKIKELLELHKTSIKLYEGMLNMGIIEEDLSEHMKESYNRSPKVIKDLENALKIIELAKKVQKSILNNE